MNWVRVNKTNPCPVCQKTDWCCISHDGSACICPRTEQGSHKHIEGSGYLHILVPLECKPDRIRSTFTIPLNDQKPRPDFECLAGQYHQAMTEQERGSLARCLGVSPKSLQRLQVGKIDESRSSWPMSQADGQVIGIRVRTLLGKIPRP